MGSLEFHDACSKKTHVLSAEVFRYRILVKSSTVVWPSFQPVGKYQVPSTSLPNTQLRHPRVHNGKHNSVLRSYTLLLIILSSDHPCAVFLMWKSYR